MITTTAMTKNTYWCVIPTGSLPPPPAPLPNSQPSFSTPLSPQPPPPPTPTPTPIRPLHSRPLFGLAGTEKTGCGDESFLRVFTSALASITEGFQPQAVVLLCGADTLSADPLGPFNLTSGGVRSCVEQVVALDIPLLLLGGGGYCPT